MVENQQEKMDMDYLQDVHDLIRVRNRPSFVLDSFVQQISLIYLSSPYFKAVQSSLTLQVLTLHLAVLGDRANGNTTPNWTDLLLDK